MRITVGEVGSNDRLVVRLNRDGIYLSARLGRKRFFFAAGPIYDLSIGVRR